MTKKIQTIAELEKLFPALKRKGKKIVLCHGVFDLMHPGHILYFQAAKRNGDILAVTVTPDPWVNKGPNRPIYNQRLRLESIAALECVDYVALNEWPTPVNTILKLKPDVFAKGQDYADATSPLTREEMATVKKVKGKMVFTHEQMFSSSSLINKFYSVYPPATQKYLSHFRERHSSDVIFQHLKTLSDLKVLVVGEAIMDQYFYCRPMGKAVKDPVIATKYVSEENFAGGTLAIANHLAGFCSRVTVISPMGTEPAINKFMRSKLADNVTFRSIPSSRPTILKRKYVEPDFLMKMFELQYFDDTPLPPSIEKQTETVLRRELPKHDIVLVADYGHGFLTERLRNVILKGAPFLCVNTQTNSANMGYNLATKYRNANYVSIDEPELRLALRTKYGDSTVLAKELHRQMKTQMLLVSKGPGGSVIISKNRMDETPVMSTRVVDRTGAGDALFAITSACVFKQIPPDIIGFIGNCVGAMKVETVCNREPINPVVLTKFVTGLLK